MLARILAAAAALLPARHAAGTNAVTTNTYSATNIVSTDLDVT